MNGEAYILAANGGNNYYFLFSLLEYEDIPLVFVAKDDNDEIYLCDCVEMRNIQRWIISKTSIETLYKIINQQITVYSALDNGNSPIVIAEYDMLNNTFTHSFCLFTDLGSDYLPDPEAFLRYCLDDAEKHIRTLFPLLYHNKLVGSDDYSLDIQSQGDRCQEEYYEVEILAEKPIGDSDFSITEQIITSDRTSFEDMRQYPVAENIPIFYLLNAA